MNNTDKQLLIDAAKADGISIDQDGVPWVPDMPDGGFSTGMDWNPLENDADAFRLMVDLHLEVAVHETCSGVINGNLIGGIIQHGNDKHAATRRAITTAAAELYRSGVK